MSKVEDITPYRSDVDSRNKGEQVRDMFDNIARNYDTMNRLMTFGIDNRWRKKCVRLASSDSPAKVLDLAAGTADLSILLAKKMPCSTITAADMSEGMLEIAAKKIAKEGLGQRIEIHVADAMKLPFDNDSFDCVTIAFGVRNFGNLSTGYSEIYRVLKPGGRIVVLELSVPRAKTVLPLYKFYTHCIIPLVGKIMTSDRRAYSYLPDSIAAVPSRNDMTGLMEKAGFRNAAWQSLTFGVATLYNATK